MKTTPFVGAFAASASAASLSTLCTTANVRDSLPANGTFLGISIFADDVTAGAIYNETIDSATFYPSGTASFCNVTFSYTHNGMDDKVWLNYWMPAPSEFKSRFLATGGEAYDINSGNSALEGGVLYGAATGLTDGGFGGFDEAFDDVFLLANGSYDAWSTVMFGYQAIKEMTMIGQYFTKEFYSQANSTKLWTYYQACSEGGREGWSQAQRAGELYDGIIVGAPAFRYGQQQANHLYSNIVEQTLDYYPGSCELDKIVNETIAFCDPLDGKTDGVISRSDLCLLDFDMDSLIGKAYYCAATTSSSLGLDYKKSKRQESSTTEPAQNGTISKEGIAVTKEIIKGLHNSKGERAYISYQIGAEFEDAATTYDSTTGKFELDIAGTGGEWVGKFLELLDESNLSTLDGVTYDTLVDWMILGMTRYYDTLQTTLTDLTPFYNHGGKILHFHGEQDPSVPTGSSVHYYEGVRQTMYPSLSYNASNEALGDWYRLFMVPGAAHCAVNDLQPNGPFPQTNFAVMIEWVEKGIKPVTLNATVLSGSYEGENGQLCAWPLRPLWTNNGTTQECVYNQRSIDTWMYDFNAYKLPLY